MSPSKLRIEYFYTISLRFNDLSERPRLPACRYPLTFVLTPGFCILLKSASERCANLETARNSVFTPLTFAG